MNAGWHVQLMIRQMIGHTDELIREADTIDADHGGTDLMPRVAGLLRQVKALLTDEADRLREKRP